MGKRSDFPREPRDFYRTPIQAVQPLIPFLTPGTTFDEPCAGDGALIDHLESFGMVCVGASDILPQRHDIEQCSVFDICDTMAEMFITNPPWNRTWLHPMIIQLSQIAPTWLLFDADWMHTIQAKRYMPWCQRIVSIGRVKWIQGSKHTGKDDCCWYLFTNIPTVGQEFIERG